MTKILLLGLEKNTNIGDVVIAECTKYLIEKICREKKKETCIDTLDIMEDDYSNVKYYDLLIFVGGGIIKYAYQKFYEYIDKITLIAQEHNVPVIFNAVGVEGYDSDDEKCQILKKAINRKCVKYISVRDDIELLEQNYIVNNAIKTSKIADPAVWSYDVYGVKKKASDVVGLGVVREGIFRSNGIDIGREELFELWGGIIAELEQRGQEWRIFTNGWSSDMKFAVNLMNHLGREDEISKKIISEPKNAQELVATISGFKTIIAGRLHANIIAYSLGVPSIGIVWNDKLKFWGENIQYPERFFEVKNFNPAVIVERAFQANVEGYAKLSRDVFASTTYSFFEDMISEMIC